jgi:hypothetical protein
MPAAAASVRKQDDAARGVRNGQITPDQYAANRNLDFSFPGWILGSGAFFDLHHHKILVEWCSASVAPVP